MEANTGLTLTTRQLLYPVMVVWGQGACGLMSQIVRTWNLLDKDDDGARLRLLPQLQLLLGVHR